MNELVAAAPLPQPIEFGKYTLFERIGRGGMADVFKGRVQGPAGFERVFVIKRILPHLSDDPQFIKMFINEAKMSARLNHPNVVQIFELGNVGSEYFISMEYIPGRDLSETMRAIWSRLGPPKPELVAFIGREMCRGLHYAHELCDENGRALNIIHRDVSPSNVMLSYEGAVKLLDFGIAKALGEAPENTKGGTLKGKYAYMSPEQASGQPILLDRRIDVFAAGIVLYELTTGRRLFKGQTDMATIDRVRRCDVPPPSKHNPMCTPELDAILRKALAKDRDERYQSAAEMGDALEEIVYSARFVPAQLRQLLADLFLSDNTGPRIERRGSQPGIQRVPSSNSVPPVAVTTTAAADAAASSSSDAAPEAGAAVPDAASSSRAAAAASPSSSSSSSDAASDQDADEAQLEPVAAPDDDAEGDGSAPGERPSASAEAKRADDAARTASNSGAESAPSARPQGAVSDRTKGVTSRTRRIAVLGGAAGLAVAALVVGIGLGFIPLPGRGVSGGQGTSPAQNSAPGVGAAVEPGAADAASSSMSRIVDVPFGSVPEGADIYIAGRTQSAGKTPITLPIELDDKSPVQVTLRLSGYEPHTQAISSNRPVFVALKPSKPLSSPTANGSDGSAPNGTKKATTTPPASRKKRSSELVNPF